MRSSCWREGHKVSRYIASIVSPVVWESLVSQMLRESFTPWVPTGQDTIALTENVALPCQGKQISYWCLWLRTRLLSGRRGLLNLGQTCFMNVVLQCLVHNPLVRNYFLSDKHNRRQCKIETCTCCEMDKLFEEVSVLSLDNKGWLILWPSDVLRRCHTIRPSWLSRYYVESFHRTFRPRSTRRTWVLHFRFEPDSLHLPRIY
jgi:hypothetical protein